MCNDVYQSQAALCTTTEQQSTRCTNVYQSQAALYTIGEHQVYQCVRSGADPGEEERKGTAKPVKIFSVKISPFSWHRPRENPFAFLTSSFIFVLTTLHFPSLNTSKPFPHAAALTRLNFSEGNSRNSILSLWHSSWKTVCESFVAWLVRSCLLYI